MLQPYGFTRLCTFGHGSEDMKHFLLDCTNVDEIRGTKIKDLQSMYEQEGVNPPAFDGEIMSAILNASGYRVDQWKDITMQYTLTQSPTEPAYPGQKECIKESREHLQPDMKKSTNVQRAQSSSSSIRSLKEHILPTNCLMSTFCHQLYTERDIQINQILLEGSSP